MFKEIDKVRLRSSTSGSIRRSLQMKNAKTPTSATSPSPLAKQAKHDTESSGADSGEDNQEQASPAKASKAGVKYSIDWTKDEAEEGIHTR